MVTTVAQYLRLSALAVVMLVLSGCSSSSIYTPVDERSIGGRQPVRVVSSQHRPDQYVVRRGDTLYSIAFRYGLDYRQLARSNSINSDYSIYPGQKLSLRLTSLGTAVASTKASASKQQKPAANPTSSAPQKPASTVTEAKPSTPVKTSRSPAKSTAVASKKALSWRWPGSGKVIKRFSNTGAVNKGINLAGNRGDPVFAAEAGRIVYAGSGLLGYGNLVIINHNQKFLSAYAHNSRILVKENDMVKMGDKIAEIGSSGATRNMLHFEIRRDGTPVDPMKYLPRNR